MKTPGEQLDELIGTVAKLHGQQAAIGSSIVGTRNDLEQQLHKLATRMARLEGRIPPPAPNPSPLPSPVPEPEPAPAPDTGFIARQPKADAHRLSANARENDLHEALATGRDVLLQAGSSIGLAITPQIKREGQLLGAYGDGNRPEITVRSDFGNRAMLDIVRADDATVTGIRFAGVPKSLGVFVGDGCDGLLLEDIDIDGCTNGIKVLGGDDWATGQHIHRCIIRNLQLPQTHEHTTGIYLEGTDGLVVEECAFDQIGNDNPTNMRRAIYAQTKEHNGLVYLFDNLFSRCAAEAFQLRGGGHALDNLLLHCEIESYAEGRNSNLSRNVVMHGASGLYAWRMDHATMHHNVFAHGHKGRDGWTQHALRVDADTHDIENNRFYKWKDSAGRFITDGSKVNDVPNIPASNREIDSLDHGTDLYALVELEANRPRGVWYGGVADAVERIQEASA